MKIEIYFALNCKNLILEGLTTCQPEGFMIAKIIGYIHHNQIKSLPFILKVITGIYFKSEQSTIQLFPNFIYHASY